MRLALQMRGGLSVGLLAFLSVISVQSQAPTPLLPPDPVIVAGSGQGRGEITILTPAGAPIVSASPFGAGFTGGVRVAAGDVDADGVTDVVVAMAGGGGRVRVYSGADGALLGSITPFGPDFADGVFVAMGDVNGDGHDDILLGAGAGGLAQLIDGATRTVLGTERPFPRPYDAGVTVAMGDLNGDGRADLIFGTTLGGFVRVFDFSSLTNFASGFPYGPTFLGGVNVAAGDVDGDGVDEVAVAPRSAGGPVRVYSARAELLIEGTPFTGVQGVNLAMGDLNGDGLDDLVMGAGAGATPRVRAFSILDRTQLFDQLPFAAGFRGGVSVAMPTAGRTRFTSAETTTFRTGLAGTFAVTTRNGSGTTLSVGGTLPAGVTFTDNGNGAATLAGTPSAGTGGTYGLTFVAMRGGRQVAQQPFTLVVQEPAAITSADAVTFASGAANTFTVTTIGTPVPAIAVTGLLPAGVTFADNGTGTGTLAGTPAPGSEGTYPLTVSASNGLGTPATQAFTLTIVSSSTPLFTSADATTATVGAVGSFLVTTSADPVAGTITISGVLPTGVTFTNHGNGTASLAGIPTAGSAGSYPVTLTADNGVATATQAFTLTVVPVGGGAPSFTSSNIVTFAVGAPGEFTVTTTGSPVATTLTSAGTLPAGVTFTSNGDGTATLAGTAASGTAGHFPLTFTADNGAGTATQPFTLRINNVGSSPVFTSGATTAFVIGTSGAFAVTTVATPAVTGITLTGALPAGVTFTNNGNGTASLGGAPQAGTGGAYPLTFTATNGGPPVDQAFTLSVQETAAITSANARAFTVGIADSFTVTTAGLPVPTIALTGALPTGVTYTDNGDGTATIEGTAAAGTYPVTLTATNGIGMAGTQAFTLAVTENTPPTLDPIADPAAILEDAAQQTINLTGISAGAGDSQPLAVTASSSAPAVVPDPAVTYTTPSPTGTLHYTPVADASGTATITVTVIDGGLDNDLGTIDDNGVVSRTFTVTVTAVNDPPTLDAVADPPAIDEDAPEQTIALTGIGAGGGETQPLQITATSANPGLVPDPAVTYASPAATGSLTYTPVAGQSGTAIVTVTVTDGGLDNDLGTPGDNSTTTDTFTVTVTDLDDPPTLDAIADPAPINEDAGLQTVNLAGISAGPGETAALNVSAISSNPALIPNPTVTYTSPNATGSLSYTPVANTSGSAVITVSVSDGGPTPTQRTFTVVVNEVNDAPTFTPGANQMVDEDAPAQTVNGFLGTVSAGPNEGAQLITVSIGNVSSPALFSAGPAISAAGVLTYTPAPEQFGVATVTYTVSDNGGTANGGIDTVGPLTFTITINAVNDPPTLDAIADPAALLEDAAQQTIALTGIGAGSPAESAQPLQITALSSNTAVIPHPTPAYTSPNATGSIAYTPVANASGTSVITVTVTDGGLDNDLGTAGDNGTLVRTFTVAVTAVNDAPSFTRGADQTVNEDAGPQTVIPWATGISAGPGESGQVVSFEITNNTNAGLFAAGPSVSAAGVLTYTPAANQNGTATITLRVTDDGGTANGGINASATQTFTITVTAVNDPPVVSNKSFTAQANMAITGLSGLLAGVTDADAGVNGCAPTFTVTNVSATTPIGGNIVNLNPAAGTFDFNPPPGVTGNVTFTYAVQDTGCPGTATSAPVTVTINVAGPVIWFVDDSAAGGGDGRLTSPFSTLSSAAAVDAPGQIIFLYSGTYTSGIALNASESLIGQGAIAASFDLLMGINPPTGTVARPSIGGTRPSISVTTGTAVTLASGNVVHGLNVSNTNGSGLVGAAVGTLALANFDISVAGGSALSLTGGGTVTAIGADNDLASTTATALNLQNVAIGAGGLTFKSISAGNNTAAPDPANGIVLNNTGSVAGLTVTGIGTTDGSGGVIQHTTGDGVILTNARFTALRNMVIGDAGATPADLPDAVTNIGGVGIRMNNADDTVLNNLRVARTAADGIEGTGVTNLSVTDTEILNAGDGNEEAGLSFRRAALLTENNLDGAVTLTNTTIVAMAEEGIAIENFTGTLNMTVTGGVIGRNANTFGGGSGFAEQGILVNADGNSVIRLAITGTLFDRPDSSAVQFMSEGSSTTPSTLAMTNVTVQQSRSLGIVIFGGQGDHTSTIESRLDFVLDNVELNNTLSTAISIQPNGRSIVRGIVRNSTVNGSGIGRGIEVLNDDVATGVVAIHDNVVSNTAFNGIFANNGDTAALDIHIRNNSVSAPLDTVPPSGLAVHGIEVNPLAEPATTCLDLAANTSAGNAASGGAGYRTRQRGPAVFRVERLSASDAANAAQVAAFLAAQNSSGTGSATVDTAYVPVASGFCAVVPFTSLP